jgi:hypothetical protein
MADETQAAAGAAASAEPVSTDNITDTAAAAERIAGLLDDAGDEIKRPDAPEAAAESDKESPEPGDTAPSEETPSGDEEAGEPAEVPLIAAPLSWDEKAKEAFKALPPHLQQTVAEREKARDAEIRRGQNEIAEQRKAIEAEQSKISTERTGYVQQLNNFLATAGQQFQDEFASIDWNRLAAEDPAAFVLKKHQFEQKQSVLRTADDERARLENQTAEDRKKAQAEHIAAQHKLLVEKVPEFADPAKAPKLRQEIVAYLQANEFTAEEIGGLTDARTVKIIRDAMRVKAMDEARAKTAVKVAAAPPKVAEPTKPGPSKEEKGVADRKAALSQLGKARSTDQQARLLERFL